jgi:NTE family protein
VEDVVVLPARSRRPAGPVAVVLSSGANMGAVQVGVLRALVEHGVRPDLVVGCSIGALNGAALAHDPTVAGVARLEEAWTTADARGVIPRPWLPPAVALIRRGESVASRDGLHRLIERSVAATSFADLAVPFHCVATDVEACTDAWFSEGPLLDALLASAAMPAMFPPVTIDGRRYIDGAVVNDVPVRRAVALGARTVYVVEVGPLSTRDWSVSRRPLGAAIEAYWVARRHRFRRELEAVPPDVEVHLMPHGDPPRLRLGDFTRTPDLIAGAHAASSAYLDALRPLGTPA